MLSKFYTLTGLLLLLTLSSLSFLQNPAPLPQQQRSFWQAWYWNNPSLEGPPVLQRAETDLDHNWGYGSPESIVASDNFSARWIMNIYVGTGAYRVNVTSDDGVRVWIDGNLIIDQWHNQPATSFSATRNLNEGSHQLMVEYYESGGEALLQFSGTFLGSLANDWRGEYYNNTGLEGGPVLVRSDSRIDFDWGKGSPAPGFISEDYFSVRWTKTVDISPGSYRFVMRVDDGGRLWVDGRLLLDAWRVQAPTTYVAETFLSQGTHEITMEYFENTLGATARFSWSRIGDPSPPPDDDDDDDGGPVLVNWNKVLPSDWRGRVPSQYHIPIQACLNYFNNIRRPLESPPNIDRILADCVSYLNRQNVGSNYDAIKLLAPRLR